MIDNFIAFQQLPIESICGVFGLLPDQVCVNFCPDVGKRCCLRRNAFLEITQVVAITAFIGPCLVGLY